MGQSISLIPDPITRSLYIRQAAVTMGIEEQILIQEVNKVIRKRNTDKLNKADRAAAETVVEAPVLLTQR